MANKQIFISYFHEDRPFARRLRARLEEEEGFKTRSDLDLEKELGADYDERLSKWLAESYFILVLLSPGTLTSDKVRAEFEEGLRRERRGKARVIPLLVEPCPRQDLDNFIGKKQYGDFTGNFEAASKVLLASLKRGPDEADEADEDET
ncbi:MAG TPA: toll/interleukin-1 receptor domain-containing protein, partial [Pyrinomonadaceae bacterium]